MSENETVKIEITGKELIHITDFLDGNENKEKLTIQQLLTKYYGDKDLTLGSYLDNEEYSTLTRFGDWIVNISDDGTNPPHDGHMYDNYVHFISPNGVETLIQNYHCLATGFTWDDNEVEELIVSYSKADLDKMKEDEIASLIKRKNKLLKKLKETEEQIFKLTR
jgi:hypothetical protein